MMTTIYDQGFAEGENEHGDSRSCPYEGTANVNEWLTGFYAGRDKRLAAASAEGAS